jgi:hypothetical protein
MLNNDDCEANAMVYFFMTVALCVKDGAAVFFFKAKQELHYDT